MSEKEKYNEEIKQKILVEIRNQIEKYEYSPIKFIQNIITSVIEIYQGDINELLFNYKKRNNLFIENDDENQH